MSREKFNWFWIASAWPPVSSALAASGLLLAASTPRIMAPISQGVCWLCWAVMREMWRCVMWLSSCPSTDASSSVLETTPIIPRCSPM